MHATTHGGVRTPYRESALRVNSWRKIPCCTGESNPRQLRTGPTLHQLSYIPAPALTCIPFKKKKKRRERERGRGRDACLVCFISKFMFENSTKDQAHQISFCNWFMSKFILLTIFSSKKKFNHSVFFDRGRGVPSSRINKCSASVRHGLDQVVNHLCWDGHPLLLECPK